MLKSTDTRENELMMSRFKREKPQTDRVHNAIFKQSRGDEMGVGDLFRKASEVIHPPQGGGGKARDSANQH